MECKYVQLYIFILDSLSYEDCSLMELNGVHINRLFETDLNKYFLSMFNNPNDIACGTFYLCDHEYDFLTNTFGYKFDVWIPF